VVECEEVEEGFRGCSMEGEILFNYKLDKVLAIGVEVNRRWFLFPF
jgi:hypothetical protein